MSQFGNKSKKIPDSAGIWQWTKRTLELTQNKIQKLYRVSRNAHVPVFNYGSIYYQENSYGNPIEDEPTGNNPGWIRSPVSADPIGNDESSNWYPNQEDPNIVSEIFEATGINMSSITVNDLEIPLVGALAAFVAIDVSSDIIFSSI